MSKNRNKCDSGEQSEDEVRAKRIGKHEYSRMGNGEAYQSLVCTLSSQEPFERFKACIKGSHYRGYSKKITVKENVISMILDAIKGGNECMMLYLNANRYASEGQESNTNIAEEEKNGNDEK